jgi:hypothetical protein
LSEEQRVKLAAETILLSLLLFLVTIMDPLLIIGIFILGTGVGGASASFCSSEAYALSFGTKLKTN